MISIIISSANPEYLIAIKKNIDETIGVLYEILAVENGNGEKGICEVYNTAGARAKYDVLCFMHEDIILHTPDWGKKVVEIMSEPKIGLLGIAGSTYKSLTPGGWACLGLNASRLKINVLQRYRFEDKQTTHLLYNANNESLARVAAVDGVFMCTRKSVFQEFHFDDQLFTYFHGYDLDYSLQVGLRYQVCVTYEVLIEHFSEGNYSEEWLHAMLLLHDKHIDRLPYAVEEISREEAQNGEKVTCKSLLKEATAHNYLISDKIGMLWKFNLRNVLGFRIFWSMHLKVLTRRY
jgi:glycosyltransferase involved in cell wall biosynthesis